LSSVLSLAVVKVVCRIGQHYECSRSSEKLSLLKVMQLSTPVGSETVPLLELIDMRFSTSYLTQRKPLGRAD
jgi:hypothetical protein